MDAKKFTGKLSVIAISILLASCGGGGGYYDKSSSSTSSSTSTTQALNISTISLSDTNGVTTNVITASGVTAKVKVTNASGKGI